VRKEKPVVAKLVDLEVMEKEDVIFETTVSGKPEPTVEWYVCILNDLMRHAE
jgi:hypothetical protein